MLSARDRDAGSVAELEMRLLAANANLRDPQFREFSR